MSVLSAWLIGLTVITQAHSEPQPKNWEKVKIASVMSTDTVVVETAENPMLWVNLLGVGTPETIDPRKESFLRGKPDLKWLEKWLPTGTPVWMERRGTTVSGRPIVLLYRVEDHFCWNAFLVKTGAAYAYEQLSFPEFTKLVSYEAQAKERKVGLWEGYEPIAQQTPPPAEEKPRRIQTVFTPPNFVAPPRRRRRYARQDTTELDMMMGAMMMNSMMGMSYGGGYGGYGYGGYGGMNSYGGYKDQHVRGYWRSNGTYVGDYMRRSPNRTW